MKNIFPILLLAAVLRLWNIAGVPPTASMDEASIGWNAYSVGKIGVDEFGEFPLISQRGYDDWRRSTYLLLVTPFVSLFGLQPVSVRMPAVILSLCAIWAVFHIVLLLFDKKLLAAVTSFLLAISPWHIYLSRIGHETNVYISFAVFGLLFFLLGVRKKQWFLISMIAFSISIISYYAGQVFVPLLGLGLIFLYRDSFSVALRDKKFRMSFILIAFVCIAAVSMTFSGSAITRFGGTSTFKPEAHYQEYTKRMQRRSEALAAGDIVGRISNSKYLFPIEVFFQSYVSHFSPVWLFLNSGREPFKVPNMGFLYTWQFPFILMGLFVLFRQKGFTPNAKKIVLLWLLLSPLPGSIATGAPHAMRTYPSVFTWQLLTGLGVVSIMYVFKKIKVWAMLFLGLFVLGGAVAFSRHYFIEFPFEQSKSFHYALSKAIPYVKIHEDKYEKIIFSNEDNLYQSYMLFLYYTRYDPALYQKQGGTRSGGYAETHAFAKYEFRPIKKDEVLEANVLYLGNAEDFPLGIKPVEMFSNLDNSVAIVAVTP